MAARRGIPVFHMEAGNRCYDDRVPEEVNRRTLITQVRSSCLTRSGARKTSSRKEFKRERIFVTGNPIKQILDSFSDRIGESDILEKSH